MNEEESKCIPARNAQDGYQYKRKSKEKPAKKKVRPDKAGSDSRTNQGIGNVGYTIWKLA
jgi:hypothetical protein